MVKVLVNVRSGSDYDVAVCAALVRGNFEGLRKTIHVNTLLKVNRQRFNGRHRFTNRRRIL